MWVYGGMDVPAYKQGRPSLWGNDVFHPLFQVSPISENLSDYGKFSKFDPFSKNIFQFSSAKMSGDLFPGLCSNITFTPYFGETSIPPTF